jgi:hypothetical protein
MVTDGDRSMLEDAFGVLMFRRCPVVSFRRLIILRARAAEIANGLHSDEATTQPLRVLLR